MIEITDKSSCCGCWACYNACPKHCITMVEDNEGFRYPKVNLDECIDCGVCEKVCPLLKPKMNDEVPITIPFNKKIRMYCGQVLLGAFLLLLLNMQ